MNGKTSSSNNNNNNSNNNNKSISVEMVVKVAHLEKQRNELRLFYWCLMKAVATTVAAAHIEKIGHIVARSEGRLKKAFLFKFGMPDTFTHKKIKTLCVSHMYNVQI